jgi:hypothetical protein
MFLAFRGRSGFAGDSEAITVEIDIPYSTPVSSNPITSMAVTVLSTTYGPTRRLGYKPIVKETIELCEWVVVSPGYMRIPAMTYTFRCPQQEILGFILGKLIT